MLKSFVFENQLSIAKNLFFLDYRYSCILLADYTTDGRERVVGRPLEISNPEQSTPSTAPSRHPRLSESDKPLLALKSTTIAIREA